jgi:signal peptidase II
VRLFLPAAVVLVLDQLTKHLFWSNARNYEIIEGYLNITLVKNAGAAFGVLQGGRIFFVAASVVAILLIAYIAARLPRQERTRRVWLGLILGGALGNLVDRVRSGEVVDFLQIGIAGHYWPVFNVADMGVTIGAALLIFHALRAQRSPGRTEPVASGGDPPPAPEDPSLRP